MMSLKYAVTFFADRNYLMLDPNSEIQNFNPGVSISRGEFIYYIVKGLNFAKTPSGSFKDVNQTNPYYNEIMIAKKSGLISGSSTSYFEPNDPLIRSDLAVVVSKAIKILGISIQTHGFSEISEFTDAMSIPQNARSSMATLIQEKLLKTKN